MERIGLLGGSFDPVHEAHLALARCATETLRLDRLKWLPAGRPWQKRSRTLAPAADRLAMLALAIEGEPCWEIDICEIERAGPTYTIDTLEYLRSRQVAATWFLILGQDQWANFDTWHRWPDILSAATPAVAGRAGEAPRAPAAVAALAPSVVLLSLAPTPISATAIRARAAAGEPLDGLVPAAVARYIHRNNLYAARS